MLCPERNLATGPRGQIQDLDSLDDTESKKPNVKRPLGDEVHSKFQADKARSLIKAGKVEIDKIRVESEGSTACM